MYVLKWKKKIGSRSYANGRVGEYFTHSNGSYATKDIETATFFFSKKNLYAGLPVSAKDAKEYFEVIKCDISPEHRESP